VDDRISIIASANLNDRSLLGDRDSEMGVVVWDDKDQLITINGLAYRANVFSHNLRLKLWNEHCGFSLDDKRMTDPISDATYKDIIILATAKKNTESFNHVFPHIPQDSIKTYSIYDTLRKQRKTILPKSRKITTYSWENSNVSSSIFIKRNTRNKVLLYQNHYTIKKTVLER